MKLQSNILYKLINGLKTFGRDLIDLTRPQIFFKYILPCVVLFLTWGLIGHLVLIRLDINSLVKNTGKVTNIEIVLEEGPRRNDKNSPLLINMSNYNDEFRLPDTYSNDFPSLLQKIIVGKTITIYTRNKWQTILCWGRQFDIYQIEMDGQILFDISKVIEVKLFQLKMIIFFWSIFSPWFLIYRLYKFYSKKT